MSDVQWGDVASWVTAVATILALVAAGLAAWATWNALKIERTRETDRLTEDERWQANAVAAWPERHRNEGSPVLFSPWVDGISVGNASTLPVFDVEITLFHASRENGELEVRAVLKPIPIVPPGGDFYPLRPRVPEPPAPWPLFEGSRGSLNEETGRYDDEEPPESILESRVSIEFSDASGKRWLRDRDGNLSKTIGV